MTKLKKLVYSLAVGALALGSIIVPGSNIALAAPAYDYELIYQSPYPATLAPGATTNVWIEVKNTGTATWYNTGANVVRLGSGSAYGSVNQQRDYNSEFANSDWLSANRPAAMLHGEVRPGWHTRFQYNIKAPANAGTYKAYFTPVVDGLTWMKDIGIYWQLAVSGTPVDPGTDPVVPGTPLSVSLSSTSPASASVPNGANGVVFARYLINGGSAATTISNLTVTRVGAGASTDFENVYLYQGDARLTTGRSVNSSTGEVTFTGLSVSVPANGTAILSVVADVNTIAGGAVASNSNAFRIENASKIVATSSFTGNFPITGNYMTITGATVGGVTVAKSGSITDPKVGDQNVKVAEFKVTASTEDITLRRIALYNGGSISSSNITALSLRQNSVEVASTSSLVRDVATFSLTNPMSIANGSDKIFQVYANVTGRPGDTVRLYVDNDADVYATGNTYGYGVNVTRTGYDNSAADGTDASWSTLQGGTVTVTSSGPNASDIAQNMNDQVFLNFSITSGVNAEVRSLALRVRGADLINGGTSIAYFKDIKIVNTATGAIVLGPKELATGGSDTDQTLTFTERFSLVAGQTINLAATMDVAVDAPANDATYVTLNAFGATDIKSLDTNDYITDIVPSTAIVGKDMTVKTSGLTLSLAATPASQTVVKNKTDVDTVGFLFTASSASAVTITSVKFTATASAGTVRDRVSSVSLYNATTGSVVGSAKALASDDTVVFSGISINVPASGTVKLVPRVNISSSAAVGTIDFDIADADVDVTSQNADGNDVVELNDAVNAGGAGVGTKNVAIVANGTLNAQVSSATPLTTIAQAGSTDVEMLRVRYSAINEAFNLNEILVKNANATEINLSNVTLVSGSTSVTGYMSGNQIKFTGLNINVPKDGNVDVIIKANMNTISAGAVSGNAILLKIDEGETGSDDVSGNDFKATGVDSGSVLTDVSNHAALTDLPGNSMVVRKTKPVITTSSVSGTLAGNIDLYSMNIAAGSGADASFKQFTFEVSANLVGGGTEIESIEVYKDGSRVDPADIVVTTTSGTTIFDGDTAMIISWATGKELVVSQGTSSTIVIKGTVDATSGAATLRLAAENTTTVETGEVTDSGDSILEIDSTADRSIIWSDNSSTSHNSTLPSTSGDWSNGYPLKTVPGATFSYTKSA